MLDPRRQLDLDLPKRIHMSHCLLTVRPVNGRQFFLTFFFVFCFCISFVIVIMDVIPHSTIHLLFNRGAVYHTPVTLIATLLDELI